MSELITRRLVIHATYNLDDVDPQHRDAITAELETMLRNLHDMAVGIGALTGNTAALLEGTTCEVDTPAGPFIEVTEDMITAEVKTDDDVFCFDAPAEDWLRGVDADDLAYICHDGDSGVITDKFWYDNAPLTLEWEKMASYLGCTTDRCAGDGLVGFSVWFDRDDVKFLSWVRTNRPDAWAVFKEEYPEDWEDSEAEIAEAEVPLPFPDEPGMPSNPIVKWVVRIPGRSLWSEHTNHLEAHDECEEVNREQLSGHKVYAVHANGDITGPYRDGRSDNDA